MLNRIIMTGRLTRDPELRTTQSNISVTSFSIANQRNYKNGNGERDTDFFDVVAWRATAEFVTKYFVKGSLVTVDGRLETRKFTDKEGNKRTVVEIIADNVFSATARTSSRRPPRVLLKRPRRALNRIFRRLRLAGLTILRRSSTTAISTGSRLSPADE